MAKLMTPAETVIAIERKLKENTGRTLDEWVELVRESPHRDAKAAQSWLKADHGVGHFQAMTIARAASQGGWATDYEDPERLLSVLFSGGKAKWRPLYERVMAEATKLGADVRISVCKTYASAYRARQFLVVRPKRDALEVKLVSGASTTIAVHEVGTDKDLAGLRKGLVRAYGEAQ
ncbi:MAG: DUF4287 domain-containing protein [Kofleriaceae bacterium]